MAIEPAAVAVLSCFVLTGAMLTAVGLRGVVGRRPFLMRGVCISGAAAAAPLATAIAILCEVRWDGLDAITVLPLSWAIATLLVALSLLRQLQGQAGFGWSAAAFRDALRDAARELGGEPVESLTAIEWSGGAVRFEFAVTGWTGLAQLRATTPAAKPLLRPLARRMNAYAKSHPTPPILGASVAYAVLGGIILAVIGIALFRRS